jgi:hypothetical protein
VEEETVRIRRYLAVASSLGLLASLSLAALVGTALASSGVVRNIPLSGQTSPQTGDYVPSGDSDVTQAEFPGQEDEDGGPAPYAGTIVNRSLANSPGNSASVNSGKKAKSTPTFVTGSRD